MRTKLDEIGYWSEIKIEIVEKYAAAYSRILAKQPGLEHLYIDAFCGAGMHESRRSGDLVAGSPTVALRITPPFKEYHFIDLDRGKTETLEAMIGADAHDSSAIHVYTADCNDVLLSEVFPRARYEDYRRALCLLDPYGLHLDWEVIRTAGAMRSVEIFLNFPIGDMNRNVLRRDPRKTKADQADRLTRYWGDETWRDAAYTTERDLFGHREKLTNQAVVDAFRHRLREVAGFSYVPEPMPMRNSNGAVIYFLFFASQRPVAAKIVNDIFSKYRDRRG